jgi:outer membrane lipoprotein-sorting protein
MDNRNELLNKLKKLEEENEALKNKLKSYTAPSRSKTYYENHKEDIKQKVKEYKEKTNYVYEVTPEKKKEYARTAYLNKKEKLQKEKEENEKFMDENI